MIEVMRPYGSREFFLLNCHGWSEVDDAHLEVIAEVENDSNLEAVTDVIDHSCRPCIHWRLL